MTGRIDVGAYLARRFDISAMNCWHMTRDAWLDLTGVDLGDRTPERITTAALIGRFNSDVPAFEELARPESPCIVLMQAAGVVPHVGVFYRGRVLQITKRGATYLPIPSATTGFSDVRFYK